ncbi:MAG: crotonase/enoyl-CoA hydratase family protein [Steroidobacteraceae bacterium]|jgi:enoyl-CoA hydratase|nr:crotonase/enoyl-CoA hydratase family protein [Steroidobacteraceae bacterium]
MGWPSLEIERDGAVGILWLNRPVKLNALDRALWDDIPAAVAELEADESVRAILLAGRGKAFCAGIDLADHAAALAGGGSISGKGDTPAAKRRALYDDIRRYQHTASCFAQASKPIIAAVHGACLGAGVDLVTACDIRLASACATFSVRETRIAMVADVGVLQRLPRIVGDGVARDLVLTGRDIDARRALEVGLVTELLADPEALLARARALAAEVAALSPLATRGAKHVMNAAARAQLNEGLDYVALWNAAFLHSGDLEEAVRAFLERRAPEFRGR